MRYEEIDNKDGFYVIHSIQGALAQTASNYGCFLIARHPIEVLRVMEVHKVAGTDAGNVYFDIIRMDNGASTGDALTVGIIDLKGTANTINSIERTGLTSARILKEKQRLVLVPTGTLTDVEDVCITLYCKFANKGNYQ